MLLSTLIAFNTAAMLLQPSAHPPKPFSIRVLEIEDHSLAILTASFGLKISPDIPSVYQDTYSRTMFVNFYLPTLLQIGS